MSIIFISDILLAVIALAWIIAAAIVDLKKREVPNWLSFSLIAIAIAIRGMAALLSAEPFYFFYGVIAFAIGFGIANALYYGRLFGGGDAKLLMGIMTAFATAPFFAKIPIATAEPFLLSFGINALTIAFVYGILFAVYAAVKNRKMFSVEFRKNRDKAKKAMFCFVAIAVALIAATFFVSFKIPLITLAVISIILPFLFMFIKAVESSSMIKSTRPENLTEGDMLAKEIKIKNMKIMPCVHGLSLREIALLRKAGKPVLIKQGLPFVPVLLAAIILSLLFGDLLMSLISLII